MVAKGFLALGCSRFFLPVLGSNCSSSEPQFAFSFHRRRTVSSRLSVCSAGMPPVGEFSTPELLEAKDAAAVESPGESIIGVEGSGPELALDGDSSMHVDTEGKVPVSQKGRTLLVEKRILHESHSKELVILCHGFRSSKESRTLLKLTDAFKEEEIAVFRFDFSGNGEKVDDLREVILHFSSQGWKINAIIGHSKGGNVVLLYASSYHDVPMVVNISGRFYLGKGIEERLGADFSERIKKDGFIDVRDESGGHLYRVTEESLMDRLSTDMHSSCTLIDSNCRVLTVHGSKDEIVPVENATGFANVIPNHELRILDGANHRYSGHFSELSSCILEFIRE
ncbi:unnamed protein product [Spirodela intermedia]|uniref:Serine aminopeptidase S33 domain-containing protein n=1 Tax=Spirodela intermedia TaxID=51605 RepID=A0A7I8IHE7_SPIIN|nr:unnamed protein product [Spirodela intermedia]CAA6657303.1 unnamed protein product [Spirodela intermedia]